MRCARVLTLICVAASGASAQPRDYLIGPQDVLAISVFDHAGLSSRYAVDADGSFSFPLLGRVSAGGRTLRQFESELQRLLADGFINAPQVAVAVEHYRSQRVFVVGEVRQPGAYPLTGETTLIEVIARAGALTAVASGEVVVVRSSGATRPILPGQVEGSEVTRVAVRDLETNSLSRSVALQDGDTVFAPRVESVYVFGEVKNPGRYPVPGELTLLQALALAGGATNVGALNRVRVIRTVDGEQREIKARLHDPIRSGDTIVVPTRYF